jgi:hypothetical protein
MVYENKYNEGMSNKMQFDLRDQASGVYLLQVNLDGVSVTKKFVIKK